MPDIEHHKIKPLLPERPKRPRIDPRYPYTELQCTSNFSFLTGASHPEEYVNAAYELGYEAIAITDFSSVAGIVRAHVLAKELQFRFIVGCRLSLTYEPFLPQKDPAPETVEILVYPTDRASYGRLCRLLTLGKRRTEKGSCTLSLSDFLAHHTGLIAIILPPPKSFLIGRSKNNTEVNFLEACKIIRQEKSHHEELFLALTNSFEYAETLSLSRLPEISQFLTIPLVVTNDAYYHSPEKRPLCDILTCIRHRTTIQEIGYKLFQNNDRFLKSPQEMYRLFRGFPQALRNTSLICDFTKGFSLSLLKYEYPDEVCPHGKTPMEYLMQLTFQGAKERYPDGVPEKVEGLLKEEFQLIEELQYEKYFLTCYDIVRFARSKNILCQGRGAAANSVVCFCLGITSVDPYRIDTLFARFVSKERNEPPDIDIDFEHERREEVIQYIYGRFGRERAAITAEVVTYRQRSAIRDVGKALGLSLDIVDKLAKSIHRWTDSKLKNEDLEEIGLNPHDKTIQNAVRYSQEIKGFPRHLSQHVGGFIISQGPLCEIVPILNAGMPDRTIIEWDKDDVDLLGMLKIDVLGLGMLTCIRKALEFINRKRLRGNQSHLELYSIPAEDPAVYDMICEADTIGVFQIESRAQMSMLPRLKPRCFYDLVIEVAIVRPGPIQGNMVHPYLKRRDGVEKVSFPDERVASVLKKTLGVPLFQEQAMRLAIVLAGFTPGEAEKLRRAMAAWKRNKELIAMFHERIVQGMTQNGYPLEFAENCMSQIKGFSEYGFPESHAASFALLVYASSWIKKHHPTEFAAALLNSLPMGFYAASQIIQDAEAHGVTVLPVDINKSGWDHRVVLNGDGTSDIRLGMRIIRGLEEQQAKLIVHAVENYGAISSIENVWRKAEIQKGSYAARLKKRTLKLLARADAFQSLGLLPREALWELSALPDDPHPLIEEKSGEENHSYLPSQSQQELMFQDYAATGLSLKAHPFEFLREILNLRGVKTAHTLKLWKNPPKNTRVSVAGVGIVRQRPGTAKGMTFITLEDETGMTNLVISPDLFDRYSSIIIQSSCILAYGKLDRVGDVIYITTEKIESLDKHILASKRGHLPNRSYSY